MTAVWCVQVILGPRAIIISETESDLPFVTSGD